MASSDMPGNQGAWRKRDPETGAELPEDRWVWVPHYTAPPPKKHYSPSVNKSIAVFTAIVIATAALIAFLDSRGGGEGARPRVPAASPSPANSAPVVLLNAKDVARNLAIGVALRMSGGVDMSAITVFAHSIREQTGCKVEAYGWFIPRDEAARAALLKEIRAEVTRLRPLWDGVHEAHNAQVQVLAGATC